MPRLTQRQQEVLDFIRLHCDSYGLTPTLREICKELGILSPNGVKYHLIALQKHGAIKVAKGKARGIVLTEQRHCPHCGNEI